MAMRTNVTTPGAKFSSDSAMKMNEAPQMPAEPRTHAYSTGP